MGWTEFMDFPQLSRTEIIRKELSQEPNAEGRAWGFEYMTERGSTVYAVGWSDAPDRGRIYFGVVCLTQRRGGFFAYKDITEDMGPYQLDAPAKMLDMLDRLAPNPNHYASEWRRKCREKIAAKKTRTEWQAGDRVEYGRTTYRLDTPAGPRKGWRVTDEATECAYRMTAHQLAKARKLEPAEQVPHFSKEVTPEQFMRDHFQFIHITG